MAKDSGTAVAQGMNINLTHVVNQDPAVVFQFICKTLEGIHKQSVSLCVGIAQLFIVRCFHADDQQKWKAEAVRDFLKAQLNERGLKQAMVYRYIATGQEIARLIQKKYAYGGVMHMILAAEDERKGYKAVYDCVMLHDYLPATEKPKLEWLLDGDNKPRFSLDVLRVNLGLDTLDATKQPGYVKPAPITNATPGTNPPTPVVPTAPPTKAAPASIVSRLTADPDALKGISTGALAVAVEKVIGREVMAERLISLCTLAECVKLQTALNTRMQVLATEPEPKPEEKPEEKAPEPDAQPTDEPSKVEQPEPTTARRTRSRRKAA